MYQCLGCFEAKDLDSVMLRGYHGHVTGISRSCYIYCVGLQSVNEFILGIIIARKH